MFELIHHPVLNLALGIMGTIGVAHILLSPMDYGEDLTVRERVLGPYAYLETHDALLTKIMVLAGRKYTRLYAALSLTVMVTGYVRALYSHLMPMEEVLAFL